jgi:hypothetical protein
MAGWLASPIDLLSMAQVLVIGLSVRCTSQQREGDVRELLLLARAADAVAPRGISVARLLFEPS